MSLSDKEIFIPRLFRNCERGLYYKKANGVILDILIKEYSEFLL